MQFYLLAHRDKPPDLKKPRLDFIHIGALAFYRQSYLHLESQLIDPIVRTDGEEKCGIALHETKKDPIPTINANTPYLSRARLNLLCMQ